MIMDKDVKYTECFECKLFIAFWECFGLTLDDFDHQHEIV